jgi:hypothetical protein
VRQRRGEEIDQGLTRWLGDGHGAAFVTHTLQHHRRDTLDSRLSAVSSSLRLSLQGSAWNRRKARLGIVGSIKAVEATWGESNGWHPHSHSVLLTDRPLSAGEVEDLEGWLYGRWLAVSEARGLGSPSRAHGVDVRAVTDAGGISDYLVKVEAGWGIGLELTRGDLKAKAGRYTPVEILTWLVETGEKLPHRLWMDWERATFGKRAIVWSRGLRQLLLGDELDQADVDLARAEGADLALLRAWVERARWNEITRDGSTGELLRSIEECAAVVLFVAAAMGHDVQPLEDQLTAWRAAA